MIKLSVLSGPDAGSVFSPVHATVIIGHGGDCDVVLNDPSAARRHCCIQRTPEHTYILSDLYSSLGTFIGDAEEPLQGDGHELQTGDEICIGGNRIRIELPQAEPHDISSQEQRSSQSAVGPVSASPSDRDQTDSPAAQPTTSSQPAQSAETRHYTMNGTSRLKRFFTTLLPPLAKRT